MMNLMVQSIVGSTVTEKVVGASASVIAFIVIFGVGSTTAPSTGGLFIGFLLAIGGAILFFSKSPEHYDPEIREKKVVKTVTTKEIGEDGEVKMMEKQTTRTI